MRMPRRHRVPSNCNSKTDALNGASIARRSLVRMPLIQKRLEWFDRTAFYAARVRNVSNVGSREFGFNHRAVRPMEASFMVMSAAHYGARKGL